MSHYGSLLAEEKDRVYLSVAASASLRDATYWLEIVFAAGIATLGLILNSPAVIIGAMLISPLMGPIMAGGLALAAGDLVLAIRAIVNLLISCFGAVALSSFLVVLLPFREMTSEIAARTSPTTLDLIVALFSGAVGAIAVCKAVRGVATSIPGVAIAVALMPPLCVVGWGTGIWLTLDRVQGEGVVRGGGLLFLTNLIAITFASMIVFLVVRIDSDEVKEKVRERRKNDPEHLFFQAWVERIHLPKGAAAIGSRTGRIVLAALFVLMVAVPLTRSFLALRREISQRQRDAVVQRRATAIWQAFYATTEKGQARSFIDSLSTSREGTVLTVSMRVFTSRPYTQDEQDRFTRELAAALDRHPATVRLALTEIPTSAFQVATRTPPEEAALPRRKSLREISDELQRRVGDALATIVLPPGVSLHSHAVSFDSGRLVLTVRYASEKDISGDAGALLAASVRSALGDPEAELRLERVEPPELNEAGSAPTGTPPRR